MENLDRLRPKKASKKRKWCVLPFARLHPLFGVGEDWGSLSHFVCLKLGSDLIDIHSHLNHYSESMEFIFIISNCSLTSSLNRDQIKGVPLPSGNKILSLCHCLLKLFDSRWHNNTLILAFHEHVSYDKHFSIWKLSGVKSDFWKRLFPLFSRVGWCKPKFSTTGYVTIQLS